jgi:hypothetical protein
MIYTLMSFRNWIEGEEFLGRVKSYVLNNARAGRGLVRFRFPQYEAMIAQKTQLARQAQQQPGLEPVRLAAGVIPKPVLNEKEGTDKPAGAVKALKAVADPQWPSAKWTAFRSIVSSDLGRIARWMGLLFETEIFIYFLKQKFRDVDETAEMRSVQLFDGRRRRYRQAIYQALENRQQANMVYFVVESNAVDVAQKMIAKTKQMLKCDPKRMRFTGGESEWKSERANPADIILYCGDNELGWNIKLTSETKIHMASLSFSGTYKLLGGSPKRFLSKWRKLTADATNYNYITVYRDAMIEILEGMVGDKFEANPKAFVNLLNTLISGKSGEGRFKTLPAARHWASASVGEPGWSGNIQKDFQVTNDPRGWLRTKDDADVTVEVPQGKSYVRIRYRRPRDSGGSRDGTSIFLIPYFGTSEPKPESDVDPWDAPEEEIPDVSSLRVNIRATNLTSSR